MIDELVIYNGIGKYSKAYDQVNKANELAETKECLKEKKSPHCSILNFWSTTCLRSHHHCNAASSAGSWAEMGLVPVHLLHLLKRRSLPTHTHTHSHTIHTCCYCTYANIQKCWHPKSLKITTIGVSTNIGLSVVQRRWRKVLVIFVSNFK